MGITEAVALGSPVTTFHSFPGSQMETLCFSAESKEDSFFGHPKDFWLFLIEVWPSVLLHTTGPVSNGISRRFKATFEGFSFFGHIVLFTFDH